MSDYISQELWMEILKRLPVKSLLICRSVCKSWNSIISSPEFACLQIHCSIKQNNTYPLVSKRNPNSEFDEYLLFRQNNNGVFTEFQNLDFPFNHQEPNLHILDDYEIVGSCDGLICLYDMTTYSIHLWNSAIRKYITISSCENSSVVGFGFDCKSRDYKVVKVVYDSMPLSFPLKFTVPSFHVYDLSTQAWRRIGVKKPTFSVCVFGASSRVYLNGAVHWFAENDAKRLLIGSFDLVDEEFAELKIPVCFNKTNDSYFSLAKCDQSIAIVQYKSLIPDGSRSLVSCHSCSIWIMKEYGVPESWIKKFNFDLKDPWRCSRVLSQWKNGDILLNMEDGEMASYNLETKVFIRLGVHGVKQVDNYVESLLLL